MTCETKKRPKNQTDQKNNRIVGQMCNPNNSCNKIAPAKLEQFDLTITAWCVRIYLLLVTCCYLYTPLIYYLGLV